MGNDNNPVNPTAAGVQSSDATGVASPQPTAMSEPSVPATTPSVVPGSAINDSVDAASDVPGTDAVSGAGSAPTTAPQSAAGGVMPAANVPAPVNEPEDTTGSGGSTV